MMSPEAGKHFILITRTYFAKEGWHACNLKSPTFLIETWVGVSIFKGIFFSPSILALGDPVA